MRRKKPNNCGVYQIKSKTKSDRIYVGSSNNLCVRKSCHFRMLRKNKHHSIKLQKHYNVYGEEDLAFSVILYCDESDLIMQEQFFIDALKPYFNMSPTASGSNGVKWSEEQKEAQSKRVKMYFSNPENKKKQSEIISEYFSDPEERKKASIRTLTYFSDIENVNRHSEIMKEYYKNNPQSEETQKKRVESMMKTIHADGYIDPRKGRHPSKEVIKRQREALDKVIHDPNYIHPLKGVKIPQEVIDKRKATWAKNKLLKKNNRDNND